MWDDATDAILGGDLTAALGYRTPAGGVVVQGVAPIGLRDREAGTVGFTTSLGFAKKLERIALDPRVALAHHSREHGSATGDAYVLVQGRARIEESPSEAEKERIRGLAVEHLGPLKEGFFWDRWLHAYYRSRVPVYIEVDRIVRWDDLRCAGTPHVVRAALPEGDARPQKPPRKGTGPRIDVARVAKRAGGTRHHLLGFAGADGRPVVLPVRLEGHDAGGLTLSCAARLPAGGRRAGLLGHSYEPQLIGLETRQYTGWLEVGRDGLGRYSPHTETGLKAPANKTLLLLLNGFMAQRGMRKYEKAR